MCRFSRRPMLLTGLAAPFLAIIRPAYAGSFEVAPILTEFAPGQMSAVVTVTNRGTLPAAAQVRSFAWSQSAGEERMDPTEALIVSPPLFELAPGRAQVVRLVLRPARPGEATGERSFRLIIDELPAPSQDQAIRFALRLSLPVFAQVSATGAPRLEWRLEPGRELVAANRGTRRARIADLAIAGANGTRTTLPINGTPYVLAGAERRWPLAEILRTGASLRLTGFGEAGPFTVDVPAR